MQNPKLYRAWLNPVQLFHTLCDAIIKDIIQVTIELKTILHLIH